MATIAGAARVERITLDLERPKQPFTLQLTSSTDTEVQAALFASGSEFNPEGWQGILWYGDVSGGIAITNTTSMWGIMSWDVTADLLPTNGRYSVQVLGARGGRLEEWATGILQVRGGLGSTMPPDWTTAGPAYDIATNALAKAELVESWGNWGPRVGALEGRTNDLNEVYSTAFRKSGGALDVGATISVRAAGGGGQTSTTTLIPQGVKFQAAGINATLYMPDIAPGATYTKFIAVRDDLLPFTAHTHNTAIHLTPEQALKIAESASTNYVAEAVGAIDFTERDPAFWREYYYGDPNIMPSPAGWFRLSAINDGAAWSVTAFYPPDGADLSRVVVPYEHDGKPVTEIGESAMRAKNIGSIVAGVLKLDYLALAENGMLSAVLLHCVDIGLSAFESNSLTDLTLGPTVPVIGEGVFWAPSPQDFKVTVPDPAADYPTTLTDGTTVVPVIRPPLHTDALVLNGVRHTEIGGSDPDPWQEVVDAGATVAITATSTRVRWTGAGNATLTLQGLTEGLPVYLVIQGVGSLTVADAYWVGGGGYVPGMANHYMAWSYNGDLLINPITATEVE